MRVSNFFWFLFWFCFGFWVFNCLYRFLITVLNVVYSGTDNWGGGGHNNGGGAQNYTTRGRAWWTSTDGSKECNHSVPRGRKKTRTSHRTVLPSCTSNSLVCSAADFPHRGLPEALPIPRLVETPAWVTRRIRSLRVLQRQVSLLPRWSIQYRDIAL